MPDPMERIRAMLFREPFQVQAAEWLRSRGVTSLPPGYSSPGEVMLDYFAHNDPAAIGRMVQEDERVHGPLPERAAAPPPQQQQAPAQPAAPPQPQQRPQSKVDPQTQARILKLLAPDKVAAQAKAMRGGSAFRQHLTPDFEQSAAAGLKKIGAVIPKGFSAGETYLAGLSLLPEADVPLFARETRSALGDATELRQARSKLMAHDYSDKVAVKLGDAAKFDPHRGVEPEQNAKEPTTRDVVAKALQEQKARAERNGEPPKTPRRLYSKEDVETQKIKDRYFPAQARPIVLAPEVAREIATEARDAAQAEAVINGDSGSVAPESSGADNA